MDKVQPLLAAYDATIARLQAKLQDRQEEVLRVEHRLEQILTENSGLLENLKTAMREAATNVCFHGDLQIVKQCETHSSLGAHHTCF